LVPLVAENAGGYGTGGIASGKLDKGVDFGLIRLS
jgi:hypothetical protein